MNKLDSETMYNISGGAFSKAVAAIILAGGIFIVGVIDGIMRPLKCNK